MDAETEAGDVVIKKLLHTFYRGSLLFDLQVNKTEKNLKIYFANKNYY